MSTSTAPTGAIAPQAHGGLRVVVEHMEDGLSEWSAMEYRHIVRCLADEPAAVAAAAGAAATSPPPQPPRLVLSAMAPAAIRDAPRDLSDGGALLTERSILELVDNDISRVLLMDPAAPQELAPEDADRGFDHVLFGGIL
ncbi:hypothetical protein HK405_009832, partial [Cladochytrium tenue]